MKENTSDSEEKKPTSFRLSGTAKKLLKKIAKAERRSEAMSLEEMIEARAKHLNITAD